MLLYGLNIRQVIYVLKMYLWSRVLPCDHRTDVIFSPDDRLIMTGTSVEKGSNDYGSLVFMDRDTLQKVYELPVVEGEVTTNYQPSIC